MNTANLASYVVRAAKVPSPAAIDNLDLHYFNPAISCSDPDSGSAYVVAGHNDRVYVYEVDTAELVCPPIHTEGLSVVAWTPVPGLLAVVYGVFEPVIAVFDVRLPTPDEPLWRHRLRARRVSSVAPWAGTSLIIVAFEDAHVQIYDVLASPDAPPVASTAHQGSLGVGADGRAPPTVAVAPAPAGNWLAVAAGGDISICTSARSMDTLLYFAHADVVKTLWEREVAGGRRLYRPDRAPTAAAPYIESVSVCGKGASYLGVVGLSDGGWVAFMPRTLAVLGFWAPSEVAAQKAQADAAARRTNSTSRVAFTADGAAIVFVRPAPPSGTSSTVAPGGRAPSSAALGAVSTASIPNGSFRDLSAEVIDLCDGNGPGSLVHADEINSVVAAPDRALLVTAGVFLKWIMR